MQQVSSTLGDAEGDGSVLDELATFCTEKWGELDQEPELVQISVQVLSAQPKQP